MPNFCIRWTGIVSAFTRQSYGFAAALTTRPTTTAIQHTHSQCSIPSFAARATRQLHVSSLHQQLLLAPKPEYEYTVAQVARAASQAVRVAVREGNVRDAYYVVNSMLQSPLEPEIKPLVSSRRLLNPIDFRRPVPSRLAVHSLVHSLMREGRTVESGREIQKMVAIGMRFRSRTLEANVLQLCSGPSRRLKEDTSIDAQDTEPSTHWEDSDANQVIEVNSTRLSPETKLALNLLSTARQSRHRRTERMYSWLVDACLLQGEIVVATLLFVILVKDWQLRKVLKASTVELEAATDNEKGKPLAKVKTTRFRLDLPSQIRAKPLGLDNTSLAIPYPEKSILQNIINSIRHNTNSQQFKLGAIESLSILADLIDQRSLPFGQISSLIRALYSCPSDPRCVISHFQHGRSIEINAYNYIHEALLRLSQSLPTENAKPSLIHPEVLPRLDTRAYNALIHYALRHCLSPASADTVIKHMTVHRRPPLKPDVVTYNTLLRSASLLRRGDLANQVIDILRKREENADHAIRTLVHNGSDGEVESPNSDLKMELGGFSQTHHRITTERMSIPDIKTPGSESCHVRLFTMRADAFTFSSYITHLVSTGRPDIVANMIFHLLPELNVVDHPACDSPSAWEWTQGEGFPSRQECIQRAVAYGPFTFAALLNALEKAGKTGLAERVWLLAREAEQASWVPSDSPDAPTPWCLPIQAYTSMMRCYANESKKGVALIHGSRFTKALSSSLSLMQDRQAWVPRPTRTRNIYVRGWAYFFLKMQTREQDFGSAEPPLRWKTSRDVGYLLLKSMRTGAASVWQELLTLEQENVHHRSPHWATRLQSLNLPVGDARFFNVVLDIFGRRPAMQARRLRASPSWWKRKLRIAQQLYGDSGWLPMAYDHTLVEIARRMTQAGYTLPLGLRRALLGRLSSRVQDGEFQDSQVRPFAFPRLTLPNFRPFSLRVTKSRGLPLGRRRTRAATLKRTKNERA